MGLCFPKHPSCFGAGMRRGLRSELTSVFEKRSQRTSCSLSHLRALEISLNPFISSKWKTNGSPPRSPGSLAAQARFSSQCPPSRCPLGNNFPLFMKISSCKSFLLYTLQPSCSLQPQRPGAAFAEFHRTREFSPNTKEGLEIIYLPLPFANYRWESEI